jgi:hypothetical protein
VHRRRWGGGAALIAAVLVGCTSEAERKAAIVDGLVRVVSEREQVEAARIRQYFERLGVGPIRRLEIASAVLEDGRTQENVEIELRPQDCITPAMIRDRTGVSFHRLPDGPPPLPPPRFGGRRVDPKPRVPSPGIEFELETGTRRSVLTIAGNDLKPDACVWSFTLRRITPE